MALAKTTHADLARELANLKKERARLDDAIVAIEAILAVGTPGAVATNTGLRGKSITGEHAARRGRERKRISNTQAVAAVLRSAGTPLSPREVRLLANRSGARLDYGAIYGALKKSPLFSKSGMKWVLRDGRVGQSAASGGNPHVPTSDGDGNAAV